MSKLSPAKRSTVMSLATVSQVRHPAEVPTSKCYLTSIPPEVRDTILRFLLVSPEPLTYEHSGFYPFPMITETNFALLGTHIKERIIDGQVWMRNPLAIACTCKELLNEAIPIYYSQNVFNFKDVNSLHMFLKNIGRNRRVWVKDLGFTLQNCLASGKTWTSKYSPSTGNIPVKAMTLLKACGPLNKLTLTVNEGSFASFNGFYGAGLTKLNEVRGCKDFVLRNECAQVYRRLPVRSEESVKEFGRALGEVICSAPETKEEIAARTAKNTEDIKARSAARISSLRK